MTLTLLESGYYHARFSANQFVQWPRDREPRQNDVFGWPLTGEQWLELTRALAGTMSCDGTKLGPL